jgi:molybdopterin converting factor small subunit
MPITIAFYGPLIDLTGKQKLVLENVRDTEALRAKLLALYPDLARVAYVIAVDRTVVSTAVSLDDGSAVALLPQYSGG